jgi:hypothetical protein
MLTVVAPALQVRRKRASLCFALQVHGSLRPRALREVPPFACLCRLSLWSWGCSEALWDYVCVCCQASNGGLIDKPGKSVKATVLGSPWACPVRCEAALVFQTTGFLPHLLLPLRAC